MSANNTLVGKVIRSFIQMASGNGFNTLASIISGYFFALFLGPGIYGIWQTVRAVSGYGSFTSLGIPFVMRRDFITLRSEGKIEEANRMAQVAMSYNFIINPIISIIIIVIALLINSDLLFKVSLILVGVLYITDIFSGIGNIIHKGVNDYKTLAIGDIINGIGVIAIIPLVYFYGYYSLLIGFLILSIIKSFYFIKKSPVAYKWVWDFTLLKKMIFTAFPMFLVTITSTVFLSIDRFLIAGLLSFKNVGLYSLSAFITQPINIFVSSFSIVLFTQLNQKYGKSQEYHVLEKQVYLPQLFFSYILPPLLCAGIILMPMLTRVFLPKYLQGVLAAQINIFSVYFILLSGFIANGLFILNKQKYTALSFFIIGCIKILGSYFAIKIGYGIEAVAFFNLLAYFLYNAIMLFFINKFLNKGINSFLHHLLDSTISPVLFLLLSLMYFIYNEEFYSRIGITQEWIKILIAELIIILIGLGFWLKAYKMITKYI